MKATISPWPPRSRCCAPRTGRGLLVGDHLDATICRRALEQGRVVVDHHDDLLGRQSSGAAPIAPPPPAHPSAPRCTRRSPPKYESWPVSSQALNHGHETQFGRGRLMKLFTSSPRKRSSSCSVKRFSCDLTRVSTAITPAPTIDWDADCRAVRLICGPHRNGATSGIFGSALAPDSGSRPRAAQPISPFCTNSDHLPRTGRVQLTLVNNKAIQHVPACHLKPPHCRW